MPLALICTRPMSGECVSKGKKTDQEKREQEKRHHRNRIQYGLGFRRKYASSVSWNRFDFFFLLVHFSNLLFSLFFFFFSLSIADSSSLHNTRYLDDVTISTDIPLNTKHLVIFPSHSFLLVCFWLVFFRNSFVILDQVQWIMALHWFRHSLSELI